MMVLDLWSSEDTLDLVETQHSRSGFQSQRPNPCYRNTMSPLVIDHALSGLPIHEGYSLRMNQAQTKKKERSQLIFLNEIKLTS